MKKTLLLCLAILGCGGAPEDTPTTTDSQALSAARGPCLATFFRWNGDRFNGLHEGESLVRGQCIVTSRGDMFVLQTDGNVVLYRYDWQVLWTAGTANRGGYRLILQRDGNLVLYTSSNRAVWSTQTSTTAREDSRLALQEDRNLVLYRTTYDFYGQNPRTAAVWNTHTAGR